MSRFASLAALLLFASVVTAEGWKSAGVWKGHGQLDSPRLSFSGDSKTLYLASGAIVKAFDVSAGKESRTALKHRAAISALHASEDGKTLTTLTREGSLAVWDPAASKTRSVIKLRVGMVGCATFSADGKSLAVFGSAGSSFRGNAVSLWEIPSGKSAGQLLGDAANVQELHFSPDGKSLAVVVDAFHMEKNDIVCLPTQDIRLWNVSSRKLARTVMKSGQPRFASDGKSLVLMSFGRQGGVAQVVDPGTGKVKLECKGHKDGTRTVELAPDGKFLATGGQDRMVKVWDTTSGKETASLSGHIAAVLAIAISPDGKTIASASEDRTVRLWTLKE
jgi:WD40 repeat protein